MNTSAVTAANKSGNGPTELRKAWADLAKSATGVIPAAIVGQPDMQDARALIDDLEVLARIVDRVVLAYGEYARDKFGITEQAVKFCFTDQLRGALDGNAFFEISFAAEELQAATRGNERSDFDEHHTLHRAAQGV